MITVEGVHYRYPGRDGPTLQGVDLHVEQGEFVLLVGPTGCGKSTLLKCLNGIVPHESAGEFSGRVVVDGLDAAGHSVPELGRHVGLVLQNPDDQLFSNVVEEEISFGLENYLVPAGQIDARIDEALRDVGAPELRSRLVAELSGGQKQKVAIAAQLAVRPRILVLDEPTSQLDPAASREIIELLRKLNGDAGITILVVEHRLHELARHCDRLVLMSKGRLILNAPPRRAFESLAPFRGLGLRLPEGIEICDALGLSERPLTPDETVQALSRHCRLARRGPSAPASHSQEPSESLIEARDVWFRYAKDAPDVLAGVDLVVGGGEMLALMGANGSGKSTLLRLMSGLLKPRRGGVTMPGANGGRGDVQMLFQNPDLMLLCGTVREEMAFAPLNFGIAIEETERRAEDALAAMTLSALSAEVPLALSRGQRLRVAVGALLTVRPRLLLLDEPTTGQDRTNIDTMMDFLGARRGECSVVVCTHDVPTVASYCDRLAILDEGRIVALGSPRDVFRDNEALDKASIHPPACMTIAQALGLGPCLSTEEVVQGIADRQE